jgi:hypothetical protein
MFVERVALNAVPAYARIAASVLSSVLGQLANGSSALRNELDAGFRELENRQPCLAEFMAGEVAQLPNAGVQGLAYFLTVLVFRAFEESFGVRVSVVQLADVTHMLARLAADGELRAGGAAGGSYSEDAIAVGQPALVGLLRREVDRAVAEDPQAPWEALDTFYESLLVMVLVLTHAVEPQAAADAWRG